MDPNKTKPVINPYLKASKKTPPPGVAPVAAAATTASSNGAPACAPGFFLPQVVKFMCTSSVLPIYA